MQLTGTQLGELKSALLASFYSESQLTQMVRLHLDQNLAAIADGDDLTDTIFKLINWAERTGNLKELVEGARNANPGNSQLRSWIDAHGSTFGIAPQPVAPPPSRPKENLGTGAAVPPRTDRSQSAASGNEQTQSRGCAGMGMGVLLGGVGTLAALIIGIWALFNLVPTDPPPQTTTAVQSEVVVAATAMPVLTNALQPADENNSLEESGNTSNTEATEAENSAPTDTPLPPPTNTPVPQAVVDISEYYPLSTSATWNYSANVGGNTGVIGAQIFEEEFMGERWPTQILSFNGQPISASVHFWDSDVLYYLGGVDGNGNVTMLSPPLPLLQEPLEVGNSWLWSGFSQTADGFGGTVALEGSGEIKIIAIGNVTVPAGTFEAIHIRQVQNLSDGFDSIVNQSDIWLSKGIGTVKQTASVGGIPVINIELTGYTP